MDPEHESEEPMHPTKEKIALLNDKARTGRLPGSTKMMLTRMVAALPEETLAHLRCAVASFDGFTEDNDPYRERDFGAIELEGERYFWKIDYCTSATHVRVRVLSAGSPSPSSPLTSRGRTTF
jgi:hypothetical protein